MHALLHLMVRRVGCGEFRLESLIFFDQTVEATEQAFDAILQGLKVPFHPGMVGIRSGGVKPRPLRFQPSQGGRRPWIG